jgi:hypothetical protein
VGPSRGGSIHIYIYIYPQAPPFAQDYRNQLSASKFIHFPYTYLSNRTGFESFLCPGLGFLDLGLDFTLSATFFNGNA